MAENSASAVTLTGEFREALRLLEAGSHLFLTGKAGTGKSTLIRLFTGSTNRNLVVAAPTGVAALNVNGYTLHRLLSFPAGVTPEFVSSGQYFPRRFAKTLKSLDTLVIDEASMIRADLLDSISIALRRFGPKPGTPFGGVQIVLVGDLYQLPPVVLDPEREYFTTAYSSPYFFAAAAYEHVEFPTVELTTIFRQDGDPTFAGILNAIRDGQATPQVVESLNEHVDPSFEPGHDDFWLTLTTTNRIADARNTAKLATLTTQQFTSHAKSTGMLDQFDKPTQEVLEFKVGAQIMLLTNDPAHRWVNGSLAVITDIARQDGEFELQVELRNGDRHMIEPHTWEITQPTTDGGTLSHEVVGTFQQLPFRLAWAVTVHKAQGLTLNRCIVDFSGGAFADGQLYVALSRARALEGLVLTKPIRARDLRVNHHIRRFHHTHSGGEHGDPVVLAANFVGEEGIQWRPRPIEFAAILPDGTELSTLLDPQRDIGDAATTLDISAEDVVLAPTLPLAWAALIPYLAERIPVGVGLPETLGLLDYELKRHGHILQLPIGIDLQAMASPHSLRQINEATRAIDKARLIKNILDRSTQGLPAATTFNAEEARFGYLLPRNSGSVTRFVAAPNSTHDLAQYLGTLVQESKNSPRLIATLQAVETETGYPVVDDTFAAARQNISDVMHEGMTLCFTGDARDPQTGEYIDRADLEDLAAARGLKSEPNLTKSRTDVLIVAGFGTQSGKAKRARQWNKPIFSVEEFLNWAGGNIVDRGPQEAHEVKVVVESLPDLTSSPVTTTPKHTTAVRG